MSKSKRSNPDSQISLFDLSQFDVNKPLPELIAIQYGFSLQAQDVDGVRYYAVPDWIRGVAQTDNARQFWREMKKRFTKAGIQLSTPCLQLKYLATNGKRYKVDFAIAETLYEITGNMDRTTGLRSKVIKYLSVAGVKMDEFRLDPSKMLKAGADAYKARGKDQDWIAERTEGVISRNDLTATLKMVVADMIRNKTNFATFTNVEYQGLFQRTAAQLRKETGAKNARDGMTAQGLAFVRIAEYTCNDLLKGRNSVSFEEACAIMRNIVADLKPGVDSLSQRLGQDIATGKTLLN